MPSIPLGVNRLCAALLWLHEARPARIALTAALDRGKASAHVSVRSLPRPGARHGRRSRRLGPGADGDARIGAGNVTAFGRARRRGGAADRRTALAALRPPYRPRRVAA